MNQLIRTLPLNMVAGVHTAKTLTASYATLDIVTTSHAGQLCFDFIYTLHASASNRNISIQIEGSPDDITTAEGSSNWFNLGSYTNSSGTWTAEDATYTKAGASGGTAYNLTALEVPTSHQRIRVRVKEDGASNFGTVKGWCSLFRYA